MNILIHKNLKNGFYFYAEAVAATREENSKYFWTFFKNINFSVCMKESSLVSFIRLLVVNYNGKPEEQKNSLNTSKDFKTRIGRIMGTPPTHRFFLR